MSALPLVRIAKDRDLDPLEFGGGSAAQHESAEPQRQQAGPGIAADELAELVRSVAEVTERLQSTHHALQAQVGQLQSELAEANEQLRRARELAALGEMAAGIAHEIRNPLGSIALDVEALREDAAERPEHRVVCERVLRAVERLDVIVGDVLRFARDLRLQRTPCEPSDIVEMALVACEAPLRRAEDEVERTIVSDGRASLDRHLLAQCLSNLVRNAAEAMADARLDRRRTITIEVRRLRRALSSGRRAEHVVFIVEDNGPGIPAEAIDRIFLPFYTTRSEGTGLGLAIVHRIVDAHGGAISARNRVDGSGVVLGARFEIAVPTQEQGSGRREARRPRTPGRADAVRSSRESGFGTGSHAGHGLDDAVRRRIGPLAG